MKDSMPLPLPIPPFLYWVIVFFFFGTSVLGLIPRLIFSYQYSELILLDFAIDFLIILPFFLLPVNRLSFIHPLIYPFLLKVTKEFFKGPWLFLNKYLNFTSYNPLESIALAAVPDAPLLIFNFKFKLLVIVSLTALYLAFFLFRPKVPKLRTYYKFRGIEWKMAVITVLFLGFFFYEMQSFGGIAGYLGAFLTAGRRHFLTGEQRTINVLLIQLPLIPLIWYVYQKDLVKWNPVFLAGLIVSLVSGFILFGSRSSILNVAIPFLIAFSLKTEKLNLSLFLAAGAAFFLLFGILGEFRQQSYYSRQLRFDLLQKINDPREMLETSVAEVSERAGNVDLVVVNMVPEKMDFLLGKTYLASLTFFIPRQFWENKPHGAGKYVGPELFNTGGGGIPPGELGEAFLNFGLGGIILAFLLKGAFLKYVLAWFTANQKNQVVIVLYILTLSISFTAIGLTDLFQNLVVFAIINFLLLL